VCIEAANHFEGSSHKILNLIQDTTNERQAEHRDQTIAILLERYELFNKFWLLVAEKKHGLERAITIAKQKLSEYETKIKKASRIRLSVKVESLRAKSSHLENDLDEMDKECKQYDELIVKLDSDFEAIHKNLFPYGEETEDEDKNKILCINNTEGGAVKVEVVHPRKEFEFRCLEDDCNELEEEIENIEEKHKHKTEQLQSIKSSLQSFGNITASVEFEKIDLE